MKQRLLLVCPDVPYPPNLNGRSIRYYPLIQQLSKAYEVTLICRWVEDHEPDLGDLEQLVDHLRVIRVNQSPKSLWARIRSLASMISPYGIPHRKYDYQAVGVANRIIQLTDGHYDCVLWAGISQGMEMALRGIDRARLVVDVVDSPSLLLRRGPEEEGLKKRLKLAKTRRWEVESIDRAHAAIYISPVDLAEVQGLVDPSVELAFAPNGVFIEEYTDSVADLPNPCLGILGNMSYRPNIEMAHALHRIWGRVREEIRGLHMCIIGRLPDPSVQALEGPGVIVTGAVPNVWRWVNAVDLFVVAMQEGAGQQNKLLEIMYAGRPVVATPQANGGLRAVDGESIVLADCEDALVDAVIDLLRDSERRKRLGAAGKRFVESEYLWDGVYRKFDAILRGPD